jgi:hypothetical protein
LGDRVSWATLNATDRRTQLPLTIEEDGLSLQDRFYEEKIKVHSEKRGFFPRARIYNLVTEECVTQELTTCLKKTPDEIISLARRICKEIPQPKNDEDTRAPKIKSFKKIFVILLMIEKMEHILDFLEEDVNDLDLPLVKAYKSGNGSRFDLKRSREIGKTLKCFRHWSQSKVTNFEEWQWTTIAPFFHGGAGRNVKHFPLQDAVMLPFTKDSRREKNNPIITEIEGGYGRVFRVDIHPDHHNFGLSKVKLIYVRCIS